MTSVDEQFNQAVERASQSLAYDKDGMFAPWWNAVDDEIDFKEVSGIVLDAVHLRNYIELVRAVKDDIVDPFYPATRQRVLDILARIDAYNEAT